MIESGSYHIAIAVMAIYAIISRLNSKHRITLQVIYSDPVNGSLEWRKIEALFLALGAEKNEGKGSAVPFFLNDKRADFHRPHPNNDTLGHRVKAACEFLEKAGITT